MTQSHFNSDHKAELDRLLLEQPEVSTTTVFGLPCYAIQGIVFATLYADGVGLTLPAPRVQGLLTQPGFGPFRPFGRNRGKAWVYRSPADPQDYHLDTSLFAEAMTYAQSLATGQPTPPAMPEGADDRAEHRFHAVATQLMRENGAITFGNMMSAPALQWQGKVFTFYYGKQMVFRLGREFVPEQHGIAHFHLLSPFKTKPPMVDWFEIPFTDHQRWEELARLAFRRLTES
jgi:hypothetical protein